MAVIVSTIRRWGPPALALALVATTLAACGSSSKSSSTSASSTAGNAQYTPSDGVTVANGVSTVPLGAVESGPHNLSFTNDRFTVKAGTVTLHLSIPEGNKLYHGIAIEGNGVDKDGPITKPGTVSTVTVQLKPGTYTFYCPVHRHEQYGMKGTLVVQ